MPNDYAARPRAEVKRKDRAVDDDAWIADLLARAPIGYLATVADGQPFINSNLFVYDPTRGAIYMHTARYGRTRANLDVAERVCLSVSEMGRLLPAEVALEFSVEYSGVAVFGSARVIDDPEEATHGLQILLDKYFPHLRPGEHYRPIIAEELARTSVYRIDIEEWSGKRKAVADDFPGAFRYPYAGEG
ncbi:pyridoxamine 5'-phosphate oxidase family protein [Oscillochloris sp. ZM17-4]|uniref:pyridoxamine 5'-phosphate oxidase family protein n=1 Tax=Oscillochloris sp. ZM17-4 TaxID=2866714 RepID=UPI001C734DE7|nr:pyridoxamine 5'-phosphate oxidase family protein [Oscillochloris sp. ZM17-4]MBX0326141.1 pyridoxamine 5'-phosphate oxidase family protein [Oscillochloris sp. ZM17-4]